VNFTPCTEDGKSVNWECTCASGNAYCISQAGEAESEVDSPADTAATGTPASNINANNVSMYGTIIGGSIGAVVIMALAVVMGHKFYHRHDRRKVHLTPALA